MKLSVCLLSFTQKRIVDMAKDNKFIETYEVESFPIRKIVKK